MKLTFTETDSCCCPSSEYNWYQTVTKDNDPQGSYVGQALPTPDIGLSPKSGKFFIDGPSILASSFATKNPITIKFRCKEKVLKNFKWGIKAKWDKNTGMHPRVLSLLEYVKLL